MQSNILTAITFFFLGAFVVAVLLLGRPTEQAFRQEASQRQNAELKIAELRQEIESRRLAQANRKLVWIPFSAATLAHLRSTGTPTLVFCEASWDATAQLTEAYVLNDEHLAALLLEQNFVLLKADCTRASPEIESFLDDVGSDAGHATIAIYSSLEQDTPIVLRNGPPCGDISVNDVLGALLGE